MVLKFAFGHKARVGKDTICEHLVEEYNFKNVSFAEPLYQSLYDSQNTFGFPKEKDREYLLLIGKWARDRDPDVFANVGEKKIKALEMDCYNICVSDLRYHNETEMLKRNGFILVKVVREVDNDGDTTSSILNDYQGWDCTIENDGDVLKLKKKIDKLIKFYS